MKELNLYRKRIGKIGENETVKYLEKKGYMIIARNFLCRQGEIDIVALDGEEYVFMEVKTRSSNHYGNPIDAVDEKKQKHIISASKYYIYKNHLENKPIRFDIVEVYRKDYQYFINHIKNVFW